MSFPVDAETIKNGTTINNLFTQQYDSWDLAYSEVSDGRDPVSLTFGELSYEIPKVITDTIKVDGTMDAFYESGLILDMKYDATGKVNAEGTTVSGKLYMVYDANNLYVYADVNDATVQTKPEEVDGKLPGNSWDGDVVEVKTGYMTTGADGLESWQGDSLG